jgi:dUTP pyrophosphatase
MQPELKVIIEPEHPEVGLPYYATEGAMAFDLCAWLDGPKLQLDPGEKALVSTGIKIELPRGYGMFMNVRSGLGAKRAIGLANEQGWIDSDYRGVVMACLINNGTGPQVIEHKERIVQCVILPIPRCHLVFGKVSDTARGQGGFGSTGS